jgi:hypothetical protein
MEILTQSTKGRIRSRPRRRRRTFYSKKKKKQKEEKEKAKTEATEQEKKVFSSPNTSLVNDKDKDKHKEKHKDKHLDPLNEFCILFDLDWEEQKKIAEKDCSRRRKEAAEQHGRDL